ncbi:hypothetical protein Emed_001229 [Eimeria media]
MESFFQAAINSVLEAAGGGSRSSRTPSSSSSSGSSSSSNNGRSTSSSNRRSGASAVRSNTTPESPGHTAGSPFRSAASFASRSAAERAAAASSASPGGPPVGPPQQGGPSQQGGPPTPRRGARGGVHSGERNRGSPSSAGDSPQTAKSSRCVRSHEPTTPSTATTPNNNNSSSSSSNSSNSSSSNSSSSNSNSNNESSSSSSSVKVGEEGSEKSRVKDKEAGERLKELGNESFRRGMYGLAAEYYSKAIAADASVASYFTNRALCHKREHRYAEALKDAESALALEETNVKGLYIKGDALVQLGDLDGGVSLLEKAEKASSSGAARAAQEIRHSLLNAKKLRFESNRQQRTVDREDLAIFLKECISVAAKERQLSPEETESRMKQLELLLKEANDANRPFEPPDFLNCRISMGLMDEPVVTPSGITYEKKLLLEHINRNGPTDPLTREPCDRKHLVPNYAIKEATSWFLDRYPWAYDA